jgi:hypothetical protein
VLKGIEQQSGSQTLKAETGVQTFLGFGEVRYGLPGMTPF